MSAERFSPDFDIVSGENVVHISFYMMASKCSLFYDKSRAAFPGNRYETYLPVTEDVLRVFVECVYDLVMNLGPSAAARITNANIHPIALLAEEFRCQQLLDITIDIFKRGDMSTAENVHGLIRAIIDGNGDLCARFEGLLARDIDQALIRLKDVRTAQVPVGHIHSILTKHVSENHGPMNDRLLYDLIMAKLSTEEEDEACILVDFLHLDRLELGQLEALFQNERVQGWPCFSGRVGDSLIRTFNSRIERFESDMRQRIAQLESENEELRRTVKGRAEPTRQGETPDAEREVAAMLESLPQSEEAILETRGRMAEITSLLEEMSNDLMEQTQSQEDGEPASEDASGPVQLRNEDASGPVQLRNEDASGPVQLQNDDANVPPEQESDHHRSKLEKWKLAGKIGVNLLLAHSLLPH